MRGKLWAASLLICSGCAGSSDSEAEKIDKTFSASANKLSLINDCQSAGDAIRNVLIQQMERDVENNKNMMLGNLVRDCDEVYYEDGGPMPSASGGDGVLPPNAAASDKNANETAAPDGQSRGGAGESTGTNNQVEGADEADFVKNDGEFIYMAARGYFTILRGWPANETKELSHTEIKGTPTHLLIKDNTAVVFSRIDEYLCNPEPWYRGGAETDVAMGRPFWGGWYTNPHMHVTVFNITDRAHPVRLESAEMDARVNFNTARLIGNKVYAVADSYRQLTGFQTWPTDLNWVSCRDTEVTADEINAKFAQLRIENLAHIAALDVTQFIPQLSVGEVQAQVIDCSNIYVPTYITSLDTISVLSFDITNPAGTASMTRVLGSSSTVYASTNNLYLASPHWDDPEFSIWSWPMPVDQEKTVIHHLALPGSEWALAGNNAALTYAGSGWVTGRIHNQFSLDEHEGHLRIATTQGWTWDDSSTNNLFVTRTCKPSEDCSGIRVTGEVRDLAKGEEIKSTRFFGNRGFMVTFRQTDPLYTFDLSDPNAPKNTGELKIPGFATYMHYLDDTHLLTAGYNASEEGRITGLQFQILGVGDMSKPTQDHVFTIPTQGSYSEAVDNHLAFTYFASHNLLALPLSVCELRDDATYEWDLKLAFAGLRVLRVTAENGFKDLGGIDHRSASVQSDAVGADSCWSFWGDPNVFVRRSIFMADAGKVYAYSLAEGDVRVAEVVDDGVTHPIAEVVMPAVPEPTTSPWEACSEGSGGPGIEDDEPKSDDAGSSDASNGSVPVSSSPN